MSIMHHHVTINFIAATRQRNPELLTDRYIIRVGNVVNRLDLLVRHEVRKHLGGDMEEAVVGDDGVHRAAVGDSGAVTAGAREGDFEDLGGGKG